jgi:anti-anti-sigma regulatory factor
VGSSGISSFVAMIKDFQSRSTVRPSLVGARPEFQRIFKAFADDHIFDFFDDETRPAASRLDQ